MGIMDETPLQKKAFEYYISLGPTRTLKDVADKFGYSKQTIYNWSSRFNWKERVFKFEQMEAERIKSIRERLSKESEEFLIQNHANLLKLVDLSVEKYFREVAEDPDRVIPLKTVKDLKHLIEVVRLLMGEPTEIRKEDSYIVDRTRVLLERLKKSTGGACGDHSQLEPAGCRH